MREIPISDVREHLGEVVGRAVRGRGTILTHSSSPAAVVISFEECQPLKTRMRTR